MALGRIQFLASAAVLWIAFSALAQSSLTPAPPNVAAPGTPNPAGPAGPPPAIVPPLDAISVKPNKSGSGGMSWGPTPDGVMGTNVTVHMMLTQGYHLNDNQLIDEPDWAKTERFDVNGKVTGPDAALVAKLTPVQKHVFFQQVLRERFGLVAYRETRELPEYALTVAKGGTKFVDGKPDANAPPGLQHGGFRMSMSGGVRKIESVGMPIDPLLQFLSNEAGRTVVDKSGLTGKYSYTLSWRPAMGQAPAEDAAESTPDLFTAIQEQLGLKLEPVKGPVDVLVIDHIERPAEN